jgi:hypothetical protein
MGIFQSKESKASLVPKPLELAASVVIAKAMYVLVRAKVPDVLHESGPLTSAEIGSKVGIKADACGRLLRACESQGLFSLNRTTDTWSNNGNSEMLRSGPGSMSTFVNHVMNESYLAYTHMESAVKAGSPDKTPWEYSSNGTPLWEWYNEHEFELHNFNQVMLDNSLRNTPFLLDGYDWKGLGESRVVDVGGGKGHLLKDIRNVNALIKPIVFDTPKMIDDAKELWNGEDGVQLVAGDFFKSVPEADVYVLKHILHDWDEDTCVNIMKTLHASASKVKGSKVLIIEMLLDDAKRLTQIQAFLDLQMLSLVNGKERSEKQWKPILEKSGFNLKRIVRTGGELVIIEAVPVV